MRRKLSWLMLFSAVIVIPVLYPGKAHATPAQGFTSTTVAEAPFAEFNVFNQFIPPGSAPQWHKLNVWRSRQRTKGVSDGYFLTNVWQPGGTTGWHTHLGHTLIIVTAGTITHYDGDDPNCTPHVYSAGMSFVDEGGTHVHIVRNEGAVEADVIAFRLIPTGQPGRIDAPAPGNCPF
jgi:quercetin dioxygenase-like cupin family protein